MINKPMVAVIETYPQVLGIQYSMHQLMYRDLQAYLVITTGEAIPYPRRPLDDAYGNHTIARDLASHYLFRLTVHNPCY